MMCNGAAKKSLVLIFFLLLPLSPISARVIEQLIAVIDGEPYTLTNISVFAKSKLNREFPTADLKQINASDREVLEQFLTEKLLEAEIRESGVKITDEEVDQYIAQIKERNRLSDEDLKAALGREGQTLPAYRIAVKQELEKSEMIERQVRKKVNITNEDVERYYKLNGKKYLTSERVRLRHIMLPLAQNASADELEAVFVTARELRERIRKGEDFAKLADAFSHGAGQGSGGDIGWIQRGAIVAPIEELAFEKLSVGEVSDPIRTTMGVHIVKLDARERGNVLPLSAVAPRIKEELYAKAIEERFAKGVKTHLRSKHHVEVKLPGVVFKAEDTKEGTVDTLMARSQRSDRREGKSFFSYLNPLTYITKEIDPEEQDPQSPLYGKKIMSVFGTPLFTTDAPDDVPDVLAPPAPQPTEKASGGFFSSVIDSINPFSSKKP